MSVVLLATFVIVIEGLVAIGCTVFAADETTLGSEWLKVLGLSRWEHFLMVCNRYRDSFVYV